MKTKTNLVVAGLLLAATSSAWAEVHYVDANGTNATPPYTNWATAARTIQQAVDAAVGGDEIVVTNGTYATGAGVVYGSQTNRAAVDKPLVLRSVNGPQATIIDGGSGVQCVYLTNGAALFGFTLTNGARGVYCDSASGVLSNCVLTGNSAYAAGGAWGGTLINCTLTGNLVLGFGAGCGGGAESCTLNNCTLTGNSASYGGGGAESCTLNNCALTGNSGNQGDGGGADSSTLNNCTLTGNSAGGASSCTLNNCILYYNTSVGAYANYNESSMLNYCCTTPLPGSGIGNISADPQLADPAHLSAGSPCRGAGSPAYASGTDIDGQPWANPPSIGYDEFYAGAMNGPLSVAILADYTNVATGFPLSFTAQILGHASASLWDFGDGTVVSNRPYTSHAWMATGDYPVILRAYNDTNPGGVAASVTVHIVEGLHYVAASSANPVAPYTSWATAATNIQDAVDAAPPGATVFVTNGIYAPVTVNTPLTLQSVNGPGVTVIDGGGTNQCLYLTNDAVLVGFTLTNGVGGVYCESTSAVLSNRVLTGNSSDWGGGAYGGTLNNCTLTGNAAYYGGGAESCTLNNCTLTGNSAQEYYDYPGQGGGLTPPRSTTAP